MAGTNIGSLSVSLGLSTGAFSSGFQKAGGMVSGFAGQVKAAGSGVGGWINKTGGMISGAFSGVGSLASSLAGAVAPLTGAIGPLAGAAGVGALGLFVKHQMGAIDASAKMADTLGITTEALAGLQYAGDLAGVGTEELGGNLERFQNLIGEANAGSKEAQTTFNALGLNWKALAAVPLDRAFGMAADGINQIGDSAGRMAAVRDVFGKGGGKMIPLLSGGSQGLAEASADVTRLGAAFSRVDAAKVEQANDAVTTIGWALKGLGSQIAVGVAPVVTNVAGWITEAVVKIRAVGGTVWDWVKAGADKVGAFLAPAVGVVSDFFTRVGEHGWAFKAILSSVWNSVTKFVGIAAQFHPISMLFGLLKGGGAFKDVGAWGGWAADVLVNGLGKVSDFLEKVVGWYETAAGKVVEFFSPVTTFFKSFVGTLIGHVGQFAEMFTAYWTLIGDVVSTGWDLGGKVVSWFGEVTGLAGGLGVSMSDAAGWGKSAGEWIVGVGEKFTVMFKTGSYVLRNLGAFWELYKTQAALSLVTLWEDFSYFFTTKIPDALGVMGRNWVRVWETLSHFAFNVVNDIGRNLGEIGKALPSLLAGNPTAAMHLFDKLIVSNTAAAFRDLGMMEQYYSPERGMTGLEAALTAERDAQAKKLGAGLADFLNKKSPQIGTAWSYELPAAAAIAGTKGLPVAAPMGKAAEEIKLPAAFAYGSKEAQSAVNRLISQSGPSGPQAQAVAQRRRQTQVLEGIHEMLRESLYIHKVGEKAQAEKVFILP